MSPIIDLQRTLAPAGRIRIGEQVPSSNGKTRPKKLSTFRFTSPNRRAIDGVAQLYGGDPHPWEDAPTEGQWEVYTPASEIPIVVPPERMSFSQWYELWSAGGCQRRCTGAVMEPEGSTCICNPENRECEIHTRLSVMLAQLPGIGLWRLDTKGYYASTELGGSFEMAEILVSSLGRSVLPGTLRLEERVVKRGGKTLKFAVPILDFEVDMGALALGKAPVAALASPSAAALPEGESDFRGGADAPSGLRPIPREDSPTPSVAEQLAAVDGDRDAGKPKRANAAPAIPATGLAPRPAAEAEADEGQTAPRPEVTDDERDAAIDRAKAKTQKAQAAAKKAPAKKAAAANKAAPPKTDDPGAAAQEHSMHLPGGELRITKAMVKAVQTGFHKMDPSYTRDQKLRYTRNVLADETIESSWDMSVGQASTLLDNLRIVNGEEPGPHGDERRGARRRFLIPLAAATLYILGYVAFTVGSLRWAPLCGFVIYVTVAACGAFTELYVVPPWRSVLKDLADRRHERSLIRSIGRHPAVIRKGPSA